MTWTRKTITASQSGAGMAELKTSFKVVIVNADAVNAFIRACEIAEELDDLSWRPEIKELQEVLSEAAAGLEVNRSP